MTTTNNILLTDLQRTLTDTPSNVVVIVGAGVTMGALGDPQLKVASWSGLLNDGLDRCKELGTMSPEDVERHRALLSSDSPEPWVLAAEAVSSRLGAPHGGEFTRWLRETVGTFADTSRDTDVLQALRGLSERGVVLATVNYDGVLERATGLPPVTWRQAARVERVLRGDERAILHLHGYWEDPESVVLGVSSYKDVVDDAHARTVLSALRMYRTLLLVGHGAGLRDPNWGSFLKWTEQVYARSEYRNYRLAREDELERVRAEHPSGQRIFALGYGAAHAALGPFLASLVPNTVTAAEPIVPRRWVILRFNIVQPNHDPVEEAEARGLVDGADPVCLEFTYRVKELATIGERAWRTIARGLDRLVAEAKAVEGPTQFLIVGRAPLPVFAYLGLKMCRMGPSVVVNKFNHKWERYPSPELCPPGGRDDATVSPPTGGLESPGRLAIALHTSKEYLPQESSLWELLRSEGATMAGLYKIQNLKYTRSEMPLTAAELPVYIRHLEAAIGWRTNLPHAEGGLVLALGCPAWLAYWVGHRLNPNVVRGRIDFPNNGAKGYVRALASPMHLSPPPAEKAKLLLMNAEPDDQVRVRGNVNFKTIRDALKQESAAFELEFHPALELREFMREIEIFAPDILHFHLHGRENGDLAFEDERGETKVVTAEHFVSMLRATGVRPALIVLSACYSATLAPALCGIAEFVIAMKSKANTDRAIEFARYFYGALARGNNLQRAIDQGIAGSQAEGVEIYRGGDVQPEDAILAPG